MERRQKSSATFVGGAMDTEDFNPDALPRTTEMRSDLSTELFPLTVHAIDHRQIETAAGRDIHAFLGIAREYATWVKAQIKRLQLVENRDFVVFPLEVRKPQAHGGRPALEYHFTEDATKHIGMASGSAKGYEIREWFIAREKHLTAVEKVTTSWDIIAQMVETGRRQALQIETLEQADQRRAAQQLAQQQEIAALQAQQIEALRLSQSADAKAEQAETKADLAEAKADSAIQNQNFWTIAEYVQYHNLRRQCPESAYTEASRHMQGYCKRERLNYRDPNILPRRIPVGDKHWETEWGFHTSVYEAAFLPWLLRRNGQQPLGLA